MEVGKILPVEAAAIPSPWNINSNTTWTTQVW